MTQDENARFDGAAGDIAVNLLSHSVRQTMAVCYARDLQHTGLFVFIAESEFGGCK
jgi:hypothetical protein